jgi:hypothetical protein
MELVLTEFHLTEFFEGLIRIISNKAYEKNIDFLYKPNNTLPIIIKADELRLRQVMLNLLSNSIKFTNYGQCKLEINSNIVDEGKMVLLTIIIEDTGVGVDSKIHEQIFKPFEQVGNRLQYSEGSGLGLSISRKLVNLMGSDIKVTSPINNNPQKGEGVGSRFSFTIKVPIILQKYDSPYIKNIKISEFEELQIPNHEVVELIYNLIKKGNVASILLEIEKIIDLENGKYKLFAKKTQEMVKEFQLMELENFIIKCMEEV